jgi:competence protein ComEA
MRRVLILLSLLAALSIPTASAAQEQASQAGSARTQMAPTVNLNTATAQQLEALPGVGPRTAQRILDYRQKNGPFKRIEDLMNIQGIGEKSFLRIKPLVTVAPSKSDKPAGPDR